MLVWTTTSFISEDEPQGPTISIGEALPQFSVEMNDGSIVSTSSLKGKSGAIVFFNTGCGDCRKELPEIQKLWAYYRADPSVEIVVIAREESEEEIQEYWSENGLTMPYSPQDTREVYSLFAPSVIPRIYVFNPAGIVTAAYGDTDMPSFDTLKADIESAANQ